MRIFMNIGRMTKFYSVGKTMKDSIPIGFIGGLMGTIAMDISNLIFKKTGLSEKTYAQYAGSVMLSPFRLLLRKNYLFGKLLHIITGSILGIPLFAILQKTGKDNHLFKGAVFATFTWELLYTLGQRLGVIRSKTYKTRTHLTALVDNLVYGLVSSATMVFLADPTIFNQSEEQVESQVEDQTYKLNEIPKGSPASADENEYNH